MALKATLFKVQLVNYGARAADIWWQQNRDKLARQSNLAVMDIPAEQVQALAGLAERSMDLQCTIDGGQAWVASERSSVEVTPPGVSARAVDRRWCQAGFSGRQCRHPSSRA